MTWEEIDLTPEQYTDILKHLEGRKDLQNSFSLFYDKALGDGDIVARLEENIKVADPYTKKILESILWEKKP